MNKKTILPKQQSLPHRQKIVVFTGAGISKESGMETFRDLDGLWKRYDPAQIATPEGFAADTEFVLNFYNEMRKMLIDIEPNHAHKIVAALEEWHDVTVITQNIDDLHERAGSSHVIHVHGELTKVTSSYDYLNPRYIQPYPLDKAIKGATKQLMVLNFALILYGLAKAYPILERVYSVCNKPIISSLLVHRSLLCLQQD